MSFSFVYLRVLSGKDFDFTLRIPYPTHEREGRLQSAERAVPTLFHNFEGHEPSFSLPECGLQAH